MPCSASSCQQDFQREAPPRMKIPVLVFAILCFVAAIALVAWATHAHGAEPAQFILN
jgi:hypothetical protein